MTQTIFTYNQEQAIKAGNSSFIAETGAYICRIISAEYVQSQSGALSLELTVETKEGLRGNYLSIYYQGKDGSPLQSGHNMIQAIMGVTRVAELTRQFKDNKAYAPQLEGKYIGLMLQKVLRTKQDGSDTYGFQILCPFFHNTQKTLAEHLENKPAERIKWLIEHIKDKDDRKKQDQQQNYQAHQQLYGQSTSSSYPPPLADNLDDEIPF